jgi:LysM repeat protein
MVQHVRKSITGLIFFVACGIACAQAPSSPLVLRPDAPDRYVVVPGDTLWGISTRYTDSPWRWPELWGMNLEEIRNPHLIYPGQIFATPGVSPPERIDPTQRTPLESETGSTTSG